MNILFILLILLISARIFSEIAERLHFPALVGELAAGILLGLLFSQFSGIFPVLTTITEDEVFLAITDLGIFFLMLYAGLELKTDDMRRSSGSFIWIAIGGMVFPLILGMVFGWIVLPESGYKPAQVLFMGIALATTALPVAIKVLSDLGKLKHKIGNIIISAAVINDVLSLILLAFLTGIIYKGKIPGIMELAIILGKILLFFIITFLIGKKLLPILHKFISKRMITEQIEFTTLLIVALAYSVLAEWLDLHFILGAFIAGLFFVRRYIKPKVYNDVKKKIEGITFGFLAPIFFVSIGLYLDLQALVNIPVIVLIIIALAMIGKIAGAGIPARLAGMSKKDALTVGYCMNARGAVELIIADIALRAGLFDHPENSEIVDNLFSAIVIMAIVTTIFTPLALKGMLKNKRPSPG